MAGELKKSSIGQYECSHGLHNRYGAGNDARIVSALSFKYRGLSVVGASLLGLADRRWWLEGHLHTGG